MRFFLGWRLLFYGTDILFWLCRPLRWTPQFCAVDLPAARTVAAVWICLLFVALGVGVGDLMPVTELRIHIGGGNGCALLVLFGLC